MKHFTIPVFIPELACPFQCIYCDQHRITGKESVPDKEEVLHTIHEHLSSFPKKKRMVDLGFFGGNFTGIPMQEQEAYLQLAQPFLNDGKINGIRLSTRPDYINDEVLDLLKRNNVSTIELGAQSLDDEVLRLSRRGHTASDVFNAAQKIRKAGFRLGLQMMLGLPGDTLQKAKLTAQGIADLGALETRIYPTLVIKGTMLDKMHRKGSYEPLSLNEAVRWAKEVMKIFEEAGIIVLRTGLHPSEGILNGNDLVAGPFHPSFKELVLTEIWHDLLKKLVHSNAQKIHIFVSPKSLNWAVGYEAKNKKFLLEHFEYVVFQKDPSLTGREFHVDYY
jgi:histone acetyltransferase (RNA polymerase elongator complex component)